MTVPGRCAGAPRVLVLGGSGAVGGGVVESARELGFAVTAAGRSPRPTPPVQERLQALGTPYLALDLGGELDDGRVETALAEHDLVVLACEPWSEAEAEGRRAMRGISSFYEVARRAGFAISVNRDRAGRGERARRIVRVGSSAAELPHALIDVPGPGWPEDRVAEGALESLASRDPQRAMPYFRDKAELARAAGEAVRRGTDVVTALPTYVLSWWGDRGGEEPLAQAHRAAKRTGLVPSVPVNVVPADVAGIGILTVGILGPPGERYQLCGVETDTHALHSLSLRHAGLDPRPLRVPRRELEDELRLLSGRPRGSPWLDLCLVGWDVWRRRLLREHCVEAWHLAVMLEGANRVGDKVRTLGCASDPALATLRYPEQVEIASRLEIAAKRKMEWLLRLGLPGV
ncbi:MAG: hypothetical protein QNK04_18390 [Myxococcota bacterium]|nr:hypothetical protein [Myxococcota bacterium]